jgi:hypothetical protein
MQRLFLLASVVLVGLAAACADKYTPFTFKDFPGYEAPSPGARADPHRTPKGYVP